MVRAKNDMVNKEARNEVPNTKRRLFLPRIVSMTLSEVFTNFHGVFADFSRSPSGPGVLEK